MEIQSKENLSSSAALVVIATTGTETTTPLVKIEAHTSSVTSITTPTPTLLLETTLLGHNNTCSSNLSELSSSSKDVPIPLQIPTENCSFQSDKIMPIRLKLSRCFEGYALNKKQENCTAPDGVPNVPPPAKQSDSCEVR